MVPQQSALRTAEIWGPVASHLSEQLGVPVELSTAPSIPEFENRVLDAQYDIAYMNPYHFTVFGDQPGYQAVAHRSGPGISGVMIVRKDSPLMGIDELNGFKLAFPAPAAFAATLVNGAEITAEGVSYSPIYTKSHDSVYRSVQAGLVQAGGGIMRTFKALPEDVRADLRILHTTARYTPHAVAVSPSMDDDLKQAVQAAFLGLSAPEILEPLRVSGFVAADYADWDDVRALNLTVIQVNKE